MRHQLLNHIAHKNVNECQIVYVSDNHLEVIQFRLKVIGINVPGFTLDMICPKSIVSYPFCSLIFCIYLTYTTLHWENTITKSKIGWIEIWIFLLSKGGGGFSYPTLSFKRFFFFLLEITINFLQTQKNKKSLRWKLLLPLEG